MKVYSISNIDQNGKFERHLTNVASVGYFERRSLVEFTKFSSRTIVNRIHYGRHSISEGECVVHVYKDINGKAAVMITDHEYPERVAQFILCNNFDKGNETVVEWEIIQDPIKVDKICKIQDNLTSTLHILHGTIESILERGEKLNDLVERSKDLSYQSRFFYKEARKNNSCCAIS